MFVKFFSIDALEPFDKEVQYWKISEFIFQISILLTGTCSCVCLQKMWMPVDNALKGYDCICFSKYESWWFMPVIRPLPCSQCCITSWDPWWVLGLVLKIRDAKIAKILVTYISLFRLFYIRKIIGIDIINLIAEYLHSASITDTISNILLLTTNMMFAFVYVL